MGLAVLGKESLDELEEMVIELFSAVVNKNMQKSAYESPYRPQHLKVQYGSLYR